MRHLPAESHVDRPIAGPGAFIATNVTGTCNMLKAAPAYWTAPGKPAGFRFHHISTDGGYGSLGLAGQFTEESPHDPHDPRDPRNPDAAWKDAAWKAASDHPVRAWHETCGLPMLLSDCSNNCGPCHFPEKLLPVVTLKALAGAPLMELMELTG